MFSTAEVRWFYEGPAPEHAHEWFRAVAGEPPLEARTDRYVLPASRDGLGVKWRSGSLEVKRLTEVIGEERFHVCVAGRVERWRKWSFPLADDASLDQPAGDWVEVGKRRRVRYFAAEEDGVRWLEDGERSSEACGFELGEVHVGGAVWWSLCFEAFGKDEHALADRLRRVATYAVAAAEPPTLGAAHALSYPAWLVRVGA